MPPVSPKILDVTVRDGSYLINHQYSPQKVAEVARWLAAAGMEYAEISHGCGIGGRSLGYPGVVDDEELLEAAKAAAPALKLTIFIPPLDFSLPLLSGLAPFFEMGRIGLAVDQMGKGEKICKKLKKLNKRVSVQLVRTHGYTPETIAQAAKQASRMGADVVYVVDTFGSMTPPEVQKYVEAVRSTAPIEVGFHGHNNLGMAIANTLSAWRAGATWLDASLLGVGRGAGNANLEVLITVLQTQDQATALKTERLCQATREVILPLFEAPPRSRTLDLLFALEKIDFSNPDLLELFSQALHIPLETLIMEIHGKMGAATLGTETHLEAVLKDRGINYKALASHLRPHS